VLSAALAADKAQKAYPAVVSPKKAAGAWSDDARSLRAQLEEQRKQMAMLRGENKRLASGRAEAGPAGAEDDCDEEASVENMVRAKDALAKVLPDSPEVKSLEQRIEEARRRRTQCKPLHTQTLLAEKHLEKKRKQLDAATKSVEELQEQLQQAGEECDVDRAAVIAAEADVNALHKRALVQLNGSVPAATAECKEAFDKVISSLPEQVVQAPENKKKLEELEAALSSVLEAARHSCQKSETEVAEAVAAKPASTTEPVPMDMDAEDEREISDIYDDFLTAAAATESGGDSASYSKDALLKRLGKMSEGLAAKRVRLGNSCG